MRVRPASNMAEHDLKRLKFIEHVKPKKKSVKVNNSQQKQGFDKFRESVHREIKHYQSEIEQLRKQNKEVLEKLNTSTSKIDSLRSVITELRAFFSSNGYSKVLGTNSLFKKAFWSIYMSILFVSCMLLVEINLNAYLSYDVVTEIKFIYDDMITFPAITLCLLDVSKEPVTSRNLSDVFVSSYFEFTKNAFTLDDFEQLRIYDLNFDRLYDCYKFNGGRNGSNHETKILSSAKIGWESGLHLNFNSKSNGHLFYYVGDNSVKPIFFELEELCELKEKHVKMVNIGIKKTVDRKLAKPFSNCSDNISSGTSDLVRQILEQNVTYRQKKCYELCYQEYLRQSAMSQNLTFAKLHGKFFFDFKGNCSRVCPVECFSTYFETFSNEMPYGAYGGEQSSFNFYYNDRRYTEIAQKEKMTAANFIANTGGVLGLFLEISFLTGCRFIMSIFDFLIS